MKKSLILLLVLVVAGAAYYALRSDSASSITVTLSEQNASGEMGTAVLEEINGAVRVTVSVSGQPDGSVQPAHIHTGACPTPGAVVYPLTSLQDNSSVTMLNVSLADLEAQLPLAINLHKSAAEAQIYIACGDLSF